MRSNKLREKTMNNIIESIIKIIKHQDYIISKVYLRGSILTNRFNKKSDIDIIVVSNHFYGISIPMRKSLFKQYQISNRVDALCLTEDEFDYFYDNIISNDLERILLIYG